MTDTERLRRLDRENEELRDMLNQIAWRLGLGDEVHYYADNYLACQLRVLDAIEGLTERESDVETVRSDAMEAWNRRAERTCQIVDNEDGCPSCSECGARVEVDE